MTDVNPQSATNGSWVDRQRGFTLFHLIIVIAIVALVMFFIAYCSSRGSGGTGGAGVVIPKGKAVVSATEGSVRGAIAAFSMATITPKCTKQEADDLTAKVAEAQIKINDAAAQYPQDYQANKSQIQNNIDNLNQAIDLYNNDCKTSIPHVTLPP